MFGNMLKFVMRSWLQVILLRYLGWLIKLVSCKLDLTLNTGFPLQANKNLNIT